MIRNTPPTYGNRPPGPGRPKDLGKRAAILATAKQLFTKQSYSGVSMDQIAAKAGVSKLTVYSHFGDKETLFSEAIRARCEEMLPSELFVQVLDGPLREQLLTIGRAFFALVTSHESIDTYRMMLTAGQGDMLMREMFWKVGPQRTLDALAELLQRHVEQGGLEINDLPRAASQFYSLIKGELHPMMMCGLCKRPSSEEVDAHIQATADFFLRAYAPR